jgi:hypothetical protein
MPGTTSSELSDIIAVHTAMNAPRAEPPNLFVSYRRADSAGHAGRIQDALRRHFGKEHVFFDVTAVAGGMDFAVAIKEAIDRSAVVAVIIGPRWGRRPFWDRLLSRADWVRFEIEYAWRAGKPVVPVLVGGAAMPRSLPAPLQFLSTIHAISLRDDRWDEDVERLTARLPLVTRSPSSASMPAALPSRRRGGIIAAAIASMLLLVWLGPLVWRTLTSGENEETSADTPTTEGRAAAGGPPAADRPATPDPAAVPAENRPSRAGTSAPSSGMTREPPANRPPTTGRIDVNVPNSIGIVSATKFTLTAKGVADPDGDDIRYRWDFGDGSPSPLSASSVTKVFERVRSYDVMLYVNDGKMKEDLAVAQTKVTVRSLTGSWLLSLQTDPKAPYQVPDSYTVELVQEGDQLSGRITPMGAGRSTVLTGQVKDPMDVSFGSESAWWNDNSDAYFDLAVSDRALMIQMSNRTPGRCSWQVPCLGARMTKQ